MDFAAHNGWLGIMFNATLDTFGLGIWGASTCFSKSWRQNADLVLAIEEAFSRSVLRQFRASFDWPAIFLVYSMHK